jgi:hypothetical protein
MATALNLTAPIKQDPESQQRLQQIISDFAAQIQPQVEAALAEVETVHYARVVVIDNKYIQVLTEFDGTAEEYAEFFRQKTGELFKLVFSLAEGAPPWEELDNPNSFFEYVNSLNLDSLGEATVGNEGRGYLFHAYGDATVREIKSSLGARSGSRT